MEKLLKLQTRLAEIDASMDALLAAGEEGFTDEQRADLKSLEANYKKTSELIQAEEQKIARAEKQRELAERIEERKRTQADKELEEKEKAQTEQAAELARTQRELALAQRAGRQVANSRMTDADVPEQVRQHAQSIIPSNVRRNVSVKHFKGVKNGYSAEERAYRFGMWVLAKATNDIPARFKFQSATEFVQKNLGPPGARSNDSTGNFNLIPEEFGTDLIDLREQFGVARRLLRMVPMTSDTRTDPRRRGGLTAVFVAEGSPGTESNKTWDNVRLTAKDIMVLSRYTNQLAMDAVISIGDDLAREIAYAFTQKEDQCAFNGDSTSTYGHIQGIRNKLQDCDGAGTDSAGLVIGTAGTGSSYGSFTMNDFHEVVARLPQYADQGMGASWICHKGFYHRVMQRLEIAAGGTTPTDISEGDRRPRPMFLGYPVDFSQVFPVTPAVAQVVCTLGDYSMGASFGDRQMDEISFSEHATIGGVSLFETNQMGIRGTERFDINVHDAGDATNPGPIVGLQTAAS